MKKFIKKLDTTILMSFVTLFVMFILACATNVHSASANSENARINRYVIAISSNYGGKNRPMLRYAESDSKSFAKVLKEMGGVKSQNIMLIKEPSVQKVRQKFDEIDKVISKNKTTEGRDEILVYYSGHADEKGLRLGLETYAWRDLRNRIDNLHADVKIAVIDACGSGAITRAKGGVQVPAFMVDQSSNMEGYAFITSSTQDESSQESDNLKGSFFTHALVSGLRGAGDLSGDGKVTLSEAYQFAFNETLQKTEATIGGAQHPSRDMNLAGTGDIVMTDLRSTLAGLEFASDVEGRLFVRDEKGELVVELNKKSGRTMSIGLSAAKYTVNLQDGNNFMVSSVVLKNGKMENLSKKQFKNVDAEQTVLRGEIGIKKSCSENDSVACSLDSLDHKGDYKITFNAIDNEKDPRKGLQLGFFSTKSDNYMLGTQISIFANIAQKEMHGMQGTFIVNVAKEHFEGLQLSGTVNYAKSFEGVQFTPTINVASQKSKGAQLSFGLNILGDSLDGAQVAAFMNIAQKSDVQVAAGLNISKESDVQVAAGFNRTEISDVQVAAGFNISHIFNSLQISSINYASKAKGRQIGVINICMECEKTPIGIFNIVGNGLWTISGIFNEMGGTGLKLDMGTALFYTSFEYARNFEEDRLFAHYGRLHQSGMGIGTHFGKYGSHFDLEYMFMNVFDEWSANTKDNTANAYFHRVRFGATKKVIKGVGLVGGVSMNLATEGYFEGEIPLKPLGDYHDDVGTKNHKGRIWPGFYAGLTLGRF